MKRLFICFPFHELPNIVVVISLTQGIPSSFYQTHNDQVPNWCKGDQRGCQKSSQVSIESRKR